MKKLLKITGMVVGVAGVFWLGNEIAKDVEQSSRWRRFGIMMEKKMYDRFMNERKDIANGLDSANAKYVAEYGYGIAMPRNEFQEEYFKEFGVHLMSIKTSGKESLVDMAYRLYKDSSERINFQFENPHTLHVNPREPLPAGFEIKVYMLLDQKLLYDRDFPGREVVSRK